MKFGLTPSQFQFILKNVVEPLENLNASVWCYGSRARGDYKAFSDLDLMIELSSEQMDQIQKRSHQIQETLQKSNFPYKVDLVLYPEFAESYKRNYEKDKVRFK